MPPLLWLLGAAAVAAGAGYFLRVLVAKRLGVSLERRLEDSRTAAEAQAKEIVVAAKEKAALILVDFEKEERERKQELRRMEERIARKEDSVQAERASLESEAEKLKQESERVREREEAARAEEERVVKKLESLSGLSRDEAKERLLNEVKEGYREELGKTIAQLERDRRAEIEKKSLEIITASIQRYGRDHIADITTTSVPLPNEELKGKIIGREGRNIKAFERLTGVEVIVDETPDSIILSSFDPLRRELAKIALIKLMKDGRIQPAKIEEKVEEARTELEAHIEKVGEEAAFEVGIVDLPKEIVNLLGRLNYRTSYGQNVLQHSVEMAHIAGMMASELGLNVGVTKKAALVHDIGKAIDHDVEGTHVELGRKLLKKYGVEEKVIGAMEAHHEEFPFSSPESYLIAAADAISAARPGARRDTLEKYLKRLQDIENTVKTFEGVKQAYAVSAGREVRVFVVPEKIDDFGAFELAKQIAGKIQADVQYPGEIKVTVVREVKAVEYAR
ncbi:MAG: ribonuclease Y [Candidatus Jorgensenbacteria bacterium]